VLHALFFAAVFTFAKFHFKPKETVIPIDLTLVVNENLDGVDNEPPPVNDPPPPEPTPPKPVEPTPPTPPPPPPVETKVDAVVKEPEKKPPEKKPEPPKETLEERIKRMRESVKAPEKKEEPKKVEEKKPEPPKKETREERMKRMKESATISKVKIKVPDAPSGNGRTERQPRTPEEIAKLLNKGYKPGSTTQIASSEMQYCISRIQQAIDARWREVMPRIGAEGTLVILARVNAQGRLVNCRLKDSCGDRTSDAAALTVVKTVPAISGLDREFLKKYAKEDLAIRYKVKAR
jgi:TonB family protein